MSKKIYEGPILLSKIINEEIKDGTKFYEEHEGRYYIVKDKMLYEQIKDNKELSNSLNNLQIMYGWFELIEDEIDIDSIEELDTYEVRKKVH